MNKKLKKLYVQLFVIFAITVTANLFFNSSCHQNENQRLDQTKIPQQKKHFTCIIFIAARNDLKSYAPHNIKQMELIGSNQNLNIIVQHHTSTKKNGKLSKTIFVEQNKQTVLQEFKDLDSGSDTTLINLCDYVIKNFPAEHYAIFFWDHGTGALEPIDDTQFKNKRFSLEFLYANWKHAYQLPFSQTIIIEDLAPQKAVCFDDESASCLNEKKLRNALSYITNSLLHGKKIDIIGFDACLMSMIEVAASIHEYADYMVASQNTELGPGWNYSRVFAPFLLGPIPPELFSKHIVSAYAQTYGATKDFTHSALLLSATKSLVDNISLVAELLKNGLKQQKSNTVALMIHKSKGRHNCARFDEPSFIDLHHFYSNMLQNLSIIEMANAQHATLLKQKLHRALEAGLQLIQALVIANKAGSLFPHAQGVSIYFPEIMIHPSYLYSYFSKNSSWRSLLIEYLVKHSSQLS